MTTQEKKIEIDRQEEKGEHAEGELVERIGLLALFSIRFKIGITNDPDERSKAYKDDYDRMVVLFQTDDLDKIRQVEDDMIEKFKAESKNRNQIAGGGGDAGDPPYYLYVVQKF